MKKLPRNSGQALLVVLLIMAVALTIGLAVTSRTVTDVEISEQSEEAARAFSAAEAGIEEALITAELEPLTGSFQEGEVSYRTTPSPLGNTNQYLFPKSDSEVRTLWLANYSDLSSSYTEDSLILFWGNSDSTEEPALEIAVYYQTGSDYKVLRYALDPIDRGDNFCLPGDDPGIPRCENVIDFEVGPFSIAGASAKYQASLDLSPATGTLLFARLRLLYSDELDQIIAAQAAGSTIFPSQGVRISSVGTAGGSTRKIEVVRLHPAPPGIFDFLLYSEGDLVK